MTAAAEAMFFDGAPVAHVVEHQERARMARKADEAREILRLRLRSPNRTTTPQADAGHLPLFIAGNEGKLL